MAFVGSDGFWWIEFYIAKKRHTEKTTFRGTSIKVGDQVKRFQRERKSQVKADVRSAEATRVRASSTNKILDQTIAEAMGEYWTEVGQYASGSADIKADFRRIIGWRDPETQVLTPGYLDPYMMISKIDTETLIMMRERRRQERVKWRTKDGLPPIDSQTGKPKLAKPISARTVNISVGERMKWLLNYMAKKGRTVQTIHWDRVWIAETPRRTVFTARHERLMLETYRQDHLPALAFALLAGPRRDQFISMRWSDVDWVARTVTFKPLKKRVVRGQHPEAYVIPITKSLEDLILSQIDSATNKPFHPEQVWTYVAERTYTNNKNGQSYVRGERYPLTYEGLGTEWARWKKAQQVLQEAEREAGNSWVDLSHTRLHDLRHSHGETLAAACSDPMLVRDALNHTDLSVTQRYMGKVNVERMRTAMGTMGSAISAADRQES